MSNKLKLENLQKKSKVFGFKKITIAILTIFIIVFSLNIYSIKSNLNYLTDIEYSKIDVKNQKFIYKDNSFNIGSKKYKIHKRYGEEETLDKFKRDTKEHYLFAKDGIVIKVNIPKSKKHTYIMMTSKGLEDGTYKIKDIFEEKKMHIYLVSNFVSEIEFIGTLISFLIYILIFEPLYFFYSVTLNAKLYVKHLKNPKKESAIYKLLYGNVSPTDITEMDGLKVRYILTDLYGYKRNNIHYLIITIIFTILGSLLNLNLVIDANTFEAFAFILIMYLFHIWIIKINHTDFIKELYLNKVEHSDLLDYHIKNQNKK